MIAPSTSRRSVSRTPSMRRAAVRRLRTEREPLARFIEFNIDDAGWSEVIRRVSRGERIHGWAL